MPLDVNGAWYPDLTPKELDIVNCRKRALLACGPRLSGKTTGILHKVVKHLDVTPDAHFAMFSRTLKNSKDGGPWRKLHKVVIPEWVNANMGFKYTTKTASGEPGWKVSGETRTPYFRIRNRYGGESECMLFSLDNDNEVEDKLKEMEFSGIYFSELDKFGDRRVLSVALPSLRLAHLKYEQMQWMADCNPSEEGEESWIYKVWYRERTQTYDQYCEDNKKIGLPALSEDLFRKHQEMLALIEIKPEENPHLDPRQVDELRQTYSYDAGLYARYVEGKWIYGDGDASRHFRNIFHKHIHVCGYAEGHEDDWEVLKPMPESTELVTGWDIGDTNHAAAIIDTPIIDRAVHYSILDEIVSVDQPVSVADFTLEVLDHVQTFEKERGRQYDLSRAWADSSALEKYQATSDTYANLEVAKYSLGRFDLLAVKKVAGTVRLRVQIIKLLLKEQRLHVSAHCFWTIEMLKNLRKGKGSLDFVVNDKYKHIFDAISYPIMEETREEMSSRMLTGKIQFGVSV